MKPTAEAAAQAYGQAADALAEKGLQIVQERIFGTLDAEAAIRAARCEAFRARGIPDDTPLNYVQSLPAAGGGFAGAIVRAVPGGGKGVRNILPERGYPPKVGEGRCAQNEPDPICVRTIFELGVARGRIWRAGDLTCIILQDVRGLAGHGEDNAPGAQAWRAIDRADRLLRENGAGYGHVVRTWFYLSNILSWYADFNQARNTLYQQYKLLPVPEGQRVLPASTGIRAELSDGAACSFDLLAVVGPGLLDATAGRPTARILRNPGQPEAFDYGSAFSRGTVVYGPHEDLVEVSGTAAIDEKGASIYGGDVRAQVRCTLEKVAGVLGQAKASLADICAATVFIKNGEDVDVVREEIAAAGLADFPAVYLVADVCRGELLVEIDAEAVVKR